MGLCVGHQGLAAVQIEHQTGKKRMSSGGGVGSGISGSAPAAAAGDDRRSSHAAMSR